MRRPMEANQAAVKMNPETIDPSARNSALSGKIRASWQMPLSNCDAGDSASSRA